MNKAQKIIVLCGLLALMAMCVVPPWFAAYSGGRLGLGYGFIFNPPTRGPLASSIDFARLLTQAIALTALTGIAFFAAGWFAQTIDDGNSSAANPPPETSPPDLVLAESPEPPPPVAAASANSPIAVPSSTAAQDRNAETGEYRRARESPNAASPQTVADVPVPVVAKVQPNARQRLGMYASWLLITVTVIALGMKLFASELPRNAGPLRRSDNLSGFFSFTIDVVEWATFFLPALSAVFCLTYLRTASCRGIASLCAILLQFGTSLFLIGTFFRALNGGDYAEMAIGNTIIALVFFGASLAIFVSVLGVTPIQNATAPATVEGEVMPSGPSVSARGWSGGLAAAEGVAGDDESPTLPIDAQQPRGAAPTATQVIACPKCQARLRVPVSLYALTVTCARCRNKFDHS